VSCYKLSNFVVVEVSQILFGAKTALKTKNKYFKCCVKIPSRFWEIGKKPQGLLLDSTCRCVCVNGYCITFGWTEFYFAWYNLCGKIKSLYRNNIAGHIFSSYIVFIVNLCVYSMTLLVLHILRSFCLCCHHFRRPKSSSSSTFHLCYFYRSVRCCYSINLQFCQLYGV